MLGVLVLKTTKLEQSIPLTLNKIDIQQEMKRHVQQNYSLPFPGIE